MPVFLSARESALSAGLSAFPAADEVSGFGVQARSVEEGALVCHWLVITTRLLVVQLV